MCLALANPNGLKKCVEGICEGSIFRESRGRNGFGYDSLFIKNDYEKTFAELDDNVKNRISHRRKAFERLSTFLETLKNSRELMHYFIDGYNLLFRLQDGRRIAKTTGSCHF